MIDLESRLRDAAGAIEWPEADVTGAVIARIEAGGRSVTGRRWARIALAAAAIALLIMATPGGRQAIANLLEVAGIRVQWGDSTATPGANLELGREVTLEEAGDLVESPLLRPAGGPDAIHYSRIPPGGAVHMVWFADDELPAAGDTGVGLLYTQMRLEDRGVLIKSLGAETAARPVEVRGQLGFWIEGAPHILFYEDETRMEQERARLAANVLAWDEDGVTHRIETTRGLDGALALAESLEPLP